MIYLSSGSFFVLKLVNVVFAEDIVIGDAPNFIFVVVDDGSLQQSKKA